MKGEESDVSPQHVASLLDDAVRLSPENPQYRRTRSGYYFDRANYEASYADSLRAAELEGSTSSYPLYTAGLAAGALGKYEEARKLFQEAIRRQPSNAQYFAGLALAELNLNHAEDALREIDVALRLAPNFQRWRYTRGLILSRMGRKDEAIGQFNGTVVFSLAQREGGIKDVYFEGNREFERCYALPADKMIRFWHYGGRWLGEEIYSEYRSMK